MVVYTMDGRWSNTFAEYFALRITHCTIPIPAYLSRTFFQYSIQSCAEAVSSANTALHPAVIKAAHSTSNCRVTATLQEIWATATWHDQGPSLHGLESSMIPTAQDAHGPRAWMRLRFAHPDWPKIGPPDPGIGGRSPSRLEPIVPRLVASAGQTSPAEASPESHLPRAGGSSPPALTKVYPPV